MYCSIVWLCSCSYVHSINGLFIMQDYETKKEWKTLCLLDSDGDGFTNGEELGDPDCVWVKGERPKGPAISHPGRCYFVTQLNVNILKTTSPREFKI